MSANAAPAVGISSSDGEALTTSAIVAEAATGSHVLLIRGYSLTKGLGIGKYISSSTFGMCGHRWYIRYYPDGDSPNNADWISIYLQLDDADAVEVKTRFKLSVVDNIGDSVLRFSKGTTSPTGCIFNSTNLCKGLSQFVKRKNLEESSYPKNDCLKIRCDVTISKYTATTQCIVVPPSNMGQHFGGLLSGALGADVTFEVAGEVVSAHRYVLAARSSVFMAELFGPMKEKTMTCIRIQDMEASVFKAMLHFTYTDALPDDIDEGDVLIQHLLVAADRYDLERLRLICEKKLCMSIDTSTVALTLELAERHRSHGLKKACLEFLKSPSHLKTVMATDGFDHLLTTCPTLMKELLAKVATCP